MHSDLPKVENQATYSVNSMTPTSTGWTGTLVADSPAGQGAQLAFASDLMWSPGKFTKAISPLRVDISFEAADRVHIKFFDPNNKRYVFRRVFGFAAMLAQVGGP